MVVAFIKGVFLGRAESKNVLEIIFNIKQVLIAKI